MFRTARSRLKFNLSRASSPAPALQSPSGWRLLATYATAAAAPVVLTGLIFLFPDTWPKPYSWQYLGIAMAMAVVGGVGAGLLVVCISIVALVWLQIPTPVHPGVEMFAVVALSLLAIIGRFRRTQRELRERAAVLQSVFEAMPEAVYVGTAEGIALCNTNALRMLGAESVEDLRARVGELARKFAIRWPDTGRPLREDELQFTRALRGETVTEEVLARNAETGADVHIRSACAPIRDGANVIGAVAINSDITDRRLALQALEAAKEAAERERVAAEEASKAKDQFLAVLSHELRTPLTPVLAGIALLKRDPSLSDRARDYVEVLRRNVEIEARLIDDLLDVTRISHGKIELSKGPTELRAILERAIEVCRPDIDTRQLHFGVDYQVIDPCVIDADAPRLQQVFWNLLKNAIKFTPKGGCVGIRCLPDGKDVVIEINDSGVGMEPHDLSTIFDAFAQGERTLNRNFGGLGLGLTISRALVERHGGTLNARSEGAGKGATFSVRLPLSSVAAPAPRPAKADKRQRPRAGRPLEVLLVEDHGDTAQMMVEMLERDGHRVETSGDVATALDAATHRPFDLLVSDLGLPDRSGVDLLRELRTRGQRMPAIAVSGYGHEQDVRESLAAGFSAHLVKPVDMARLLEAIDVAIQG